jgi:hypothetical protein
MSGIGDAVPGLAYRFCWRANALGGVFGLLENPDAV